MKSLGELLIFALLIGTNGRVFFVRSRKDAIVVLSPLCFFLSVFQILSWGLDIFTATTLLMSFLVLLSNFHAIYRYFEHLYIDHYSILMYAWAVSTCLICGFCFVATLVFRTPEFDFSKQNVSVETTRYSGSFRAGFEKAGIFDRNSLILHHFYGTAKTEADEKPVIIFFADKRGDTYNYIPLLSDIAEKGYHVYSADFYSKDCKWVHSVADSRLFRRSYLITQSLLNKQKFVSQREFYSYNISLEIPVLINLIGQNHSENTKYFLISDFMGTSALNDFEQMNQNKIAGTFNIESISEYTTSGYGLISETNKILATYFGEDLKNSEAQKNAIVEKTVKQIEGATEIKNDTESAE